ncbi:hypothetical protein LguiB_029050 [Lonicera macranthoides]
MNKNKSKRVIYLYICSPWVGLLYNAGVESIAMDMKEKKLTVTGNIDPVDIVGKLRKLCHTDIVSVGPAAKEPEKKKEEPKKEPEKKKEEPIKDNQVQLLNAQLLKAYHQQYYQQLHQPLAVPTHYRSMEEDPNACVIC